MACSLGQRQQQGGLGQGRYVPPLLAVVALQCYTLHSQHLLFLGLLPVPLVLGWRLVFLDDASRFNSRLQRVGRLITSGSGVRDSLFGLRSQAGPGLARG